MRFTLAGGMLKEKNIALPLIGRNPTALPLIFLLLAACSNDQVALHVSEAAPYGVDVIGLPDVDPCSLVQAPLLSAMHQPRQNPLDARIEYYQHAVSGSTLPIAYLEKLGWAFVSKARASMDPGFYNLAEQTANCIQLKQTGSLEALLLKGHVLHNLHKFKQAEQLARRLVDQRGLWFEYGLLGDVLLEQGRLDEAAKAYQQMMDQRPGPQAYIRAAQLRWFKGDLSGAIELMRRTVRAIGSRDPESAAWVLVRLGRYLLQAGELELTTLRIARALELQPGYPPALLLQGHLLLAQGRSEEALGVLSRAVEANPLPEYQWTFAEALTSAGQHETAKLIQVQLEQRGAQEDARTYALYLASSGKQPDRALQLSREELEVREDVLTLDTLAWALRATGRIQEAHSFSQRALAEGTQDARLFYHAGIISADFGDYREASLWLTKAIDIQHMLLPSERERLGKEFAALKLHLPTLAVQLSDRQDSPTP